MIVHPLPLRKENKMFYFIPQIGQSDCGFACLKMLIAHLYDNQDALYLKQDENHGPYSFKELKDIGELYGVILQGVEVEDIERIKNIPLPFIGLVSKGEGVKHFILVTKIKWGNVYYLDPAEGECSLSIKAFLSVWTNNALIIDEFDKKEIEFKKRLPAKNRYNIPSLILQIISALSLFMGIYFIDDKTVIYIPIIFLSLSLVMEIVLRSLLIKRMESIDNTYLRSINAERKTFFSLYERYEEYKKTSISSKMNVIFSFLIIIFLAVITLINNIYNAFLVLIPLFLAIIDVKSISPKLKNMEHTIYKEEQDILSIRNIDIFKNQMQKIHYKAYKIARTTLLKRYIFLALIILTALLTSIFNESFSLPYVIFYFFLGYTLFEQYIAFLNYPLRNNEYLISSVKLNNVISDL